MEFAMESMLGTFRDGHVILDGNVVWPSETRVAITPIGLESATEIVRETGPSVSDEEFERLVDEMCDIVDASVGKGRMPLSDYAVSREGIYEDHP
jgi:hypothetical protein